MAGKVIIGCKLPHGIVLTHPQEPHKKVQINGLNKAIIKGAPHVHTEVDEEFWGAWKAVHHSFPALKSGAIFVAKNHEEAKAKSKELAHEKTGFEPMPQDAPGVQKDDGR